ncbi:sensor histidine kinase [Bombilactobacillus thymidiniphilus]|uniref:histidine kinase n=1 Tax=Bombilactobacillus thymidiniphilus TaxID=2923363 RepID=A0ABY4PCR2_9LACO|nr:ATP-binding protein [Bombilactobacillus thymidiniphilus]UQS83311.1 cell wall metabolism sensor histidine kinase WalK [Bombilactobacillus thymidiniphilus]
MKRQRRTILLTACVGILVYIFCLVILTQFNKQEQIKHLVALRSDYQVFQANTNQADLNSWESDHQLKVVKLQPNSHNLLQKQVHDLLSQDQLNSKHPYQIGHYQGRKYLFYLLTTKDINQQQVLVKKYRSIWQASSLVTCFSVIYLCLWVLGFMVQYLTYRQQRKYIHALVHKLHNINDNQHTDSLITKDNTPYIELIHTVNALDKNYSQLAENNALLQRRFSSLLKHLPVGVMLLDDAGNVLLHNQAMATILGRELEDQVHPFVDDVQTYALSKLIKHTLKDNHSRHQEIQLFGGANRFVDANVIRIVPDDESLDQQVIVILYDLTNLHQIEQQQLDFVGNVSHELKTPLTAIMGFTDTLLQGALNDPVKAKEFLQIIQKETGRLSNLVDDSLALTTMDQAKTSAPQTVDIAELINTALLQRRKRITALNLTVTKHFTGILQVQIAVDEITQIVTNLLSNAIKYNRQNGSIKIVVQQDQDYLNLIVQDSGRGIALEDQDHVFERFYRCDKSRNQQISGTGLGLAIVQQAVRKLNGTIKLASQLNKGTTVKVHLPL